MANTVFLKLGGSLITDKTGVEDVREEVLARLAVEIRQARERQPGLRLLIGHGSGSFGHVAAAKYGTRQGVKSESQWHGFTEVSAAASRLNEMVIAALQDAGLPAISLQPSASAICQAGRIVEFGVRPVELALAVGLVPVVFGDVAFDHQLGGTIISTEEIMIYLARSLQPEWLYLAGETAGVLDHDHRVVPMITAVNLEEILPALGGSRGTDVTGGMATKVKSMVDLVATYPRMKILIFSGLEENNLFTALRNPLDIKGTIIRH